MHAKHLHVSEIAAQTLAFPYDGRACSVKQKLDRITRHPARLPRDSRRTQGLSLRDQRPVLRPTLMQTLQIIDIRQCQKLGRI